MAARGSSARPWLGNRALLLRRSTSLGAASPSSVHPSLARREFHLLPSQELSLLSTHIPSIVAPQPIKSASEVSSASDRSGPVHLRVDVQDGDASSGEFVRLINSSSTQSLGIRGSDHLISDAKAAEKVVGKLLEKSIRFASKLPPYNLKQFDRVLLSQASTKQTSETPLRLQVLLIADRKPHPHPSRPGVHFGPTLSLTTLPSSIPITTARTAFPDLTSVTCIDVSSLEPMGALESKDNSVKAEQALSSLAEKTASEAIRDATDKLGLALTQGQDRLLRATLKDLVVLYWKSDGERFVLDLEVNGSEGKVDVRSQTLAFDDYTAGKAGRQKLLNALRQDGRLTPQDSIPDSSPLGSSLENKVSALNHDLSALEAEAEAEGLIYRTHQGGEIALFGYGAGMGMGTLDGVIAAGGKPSNFFDGGGGATRENAKAAMRVISKDPTVKCVFVNIFGGITKSDQVALGIVDGFKEYGMMHLPLIARFKGNKAQEAQDTLRASKLKVRLVGSLREGAKEAVNAAAAVRSSSASSSFQSGGKRAYSTLSAVRQRGRTQGRRTFSTSAVWSSVASKQPFAFVTGYAFAGKPREGAEEAAARAALAAVAAGKPPPEQPEIKPAVRIGFSPDTDVGRWIDELLQGGEAGEDALACADMGYEDGQVDQDGDVLLAVADGVGGWTESGVDPSLFSQALMFHVTQRASKYKACPDRITGEELSSSVESTSEEHPGSPLALLEHAYDAVQLDPRVIAGSATACVITLDTSKGVLRSANLGDSGFVVLRKGVNSSTASSPSSESSSEEEGVKETQKTNESKLRQAHQPASTRSAQRPQEGVYFASTPLQLGFNTPLQLAKLPPSMVQEGSIANKPRDAATWECHLRNGDLIVVGTDGLWDNVHNAEIVQLTKFIKEKHHAAWTARHPGQSRMSAGASDDAKTKDPMAEEKSFIQVLANNLVEYTRMCQFSQSKRSPFEVEAERYGIHYPGGKIDDVAVVIALVVER